MQKAIDLARDMAKEPEKNFTLRLEENNWHRVFQDIIKIGLPHRDTNILIAFVIFSYDNDSQKIDIRKERYENKYSIADNIGLDVKSEIIKEILINANENFNTVVGNYLHLLTDWRWQTIFTLLDYHSNMIRFANQKTDAEKSFERMNKEGEVKTLTVEYDIDTIARVNKQKGELLDLAIQAREKADKLLTEIKKDFVNTDTATQGDFGFTFTETAKNKMDAYSWSDFLKYHYLPKKNNHL